MTARRRQRDGAVLWLTGQSVLFGAMAALLGVVANALFLEAYGPQLLPVTYVVIGVAGIVISGAIARASQRFDLLRIAVGVLAAAAVLFALSWLLALAPGGAWLSAPLLVLFPILLQLGFVFIGGQAGRMLDIAGIKASFPRIIAGFPAGAALGGLVAGPLVDITGRSEDLLLATAAAQGAFTALVWATGRRYRARLELPATAINGRSGAAEAGSTDDGDGGASSLRRLLGSRFVLLILAYQVLSAVASQLADYLVFDRADAAHPTAEALARFIGGYTAVMNAVSIAFLFLLAGPLLRRFGLRLGIAANPGVLLAMAGLSTAALAITGAGSIALLAVVSAARIADIALTDGTTRTSINATYQVLPARPRIAVQTTVEGLGVPVAIGVSGVLILVLNALPDALPWTLGALLVTCAIWTWVGLRLYAAYGPALVEALQRRRAFDPDAGIETTVDDVAATRRLITSGDPRSAGLGIDLASAMDVAALAPELVALANDARAGTEARLAALSVLAIGGDAAARSRLASEVARAATSPEPAVRVAAAQASGALETADRTLVAQRLLDDPEVEVRRAALEAVRPGDQSLDAVVAGLRDPATAPAAMRAFDRLGDAVVPALRAALADPAGAAQPVTMRMLRALVTPSPARDVALEAHVAHRDRSIGRLVLERLGAMGPGHVSLVRQLRDLLREDTEHARRILAARLAIANNGDPGDGGTNGDAAVLRALDDELDLVRAHAAAALAARHGRDRLGQSVARLAAGGESVALAIEAIEVVAGPADARLASALFESSLTDAARLERLQSIAVPGEGMHGEAVADAGADATSWLRSIVEDADTTRRSPWLRACAIRALRLRGMLDVTDLESAAALGDPIVDEELALSATDRGVRSADAPP